MNRIKLAVILSLLATQGACATRGMHKPYPKTDAAQEVVTTWGASDPTTELEWTYQDSPTPPFEGTPDYALTEIAFAQNSTGLDREASGALRTARDNLEAGGDREDPSEFRLLVVGFADSIAERAQAEGLGLRRAQATRSQLVKLGFHKDNIQVASYGARYSAAQSWEKIKQELERNVQVWVLK